MIKRDANWLVLKGNNILMLPYNDLLYIYIYVCKRRIINIKYIVISNKYQDKRCKVNVLLVFTSW